MASVIHPVEMADTSQEDTKITIDALYSKAHSLIYSRPDTAKELVSTMRRLGADCPESIWNIRSLNMLGIIYDVQSEYDSALYYYYRAYTAAVALNDYQEMGSSSNNIGLTHWNIGNNKDALDYFFRALDYFDKADIQHTLGNIRNNIGLLYAGLGDFERSRTNYQMAYRAFRENNDIRGLGAVLTNKGLLLLASEQPDSALYFTDRSIEYKSRVNDFYGKSISLESQGRIFLAKGIYARARESFTKSLLISQSLGYSHGIIRAQIGLAKEKIQQSKYPKALELMREALDSAKVIESDKLIYQVHEVKADIYERTHNHKEALEHFRLANHIRNESINHSQLNQVYDLELQQALKENLREIDQLSKEKEIQRLQLEGKDLEIRRKNTFLLMVVAMFALGSTVIYFFYYNYRHVQNTKLQKAIVKNKENLSRAAIEAELQERKRIGQELHDGIGQMLSVVRMNIDVLQKREDLSGNKRTELLSSAVDIVDYAFKEVRNISHNLAPAVLSEKGLGQALKTLANQINKSKQIHVRMETMDLYHVRDNVTQNTIYRAVQELVNNALKHSSASELFVQVISDAVQASIVVEDNGKGFPATELGDGNGSGLKHLCNRIENLNGNFYMDSRENRGSIFQIFIPLNYNGHENKNN